MRRLITGFHRDEEGDWVAELDCLHGQHVRHQPPFRVAPWVLDEDERRARVGAPLDCPLCDRAELPVEVLAGEVRFTAATDPPLDVVVTPAGPQPVPPEVDHDVEPGPDARLRVTFLTR